MKYNEHIKRNQKELGFTGKDVDGLRGPMTNQAILAAADAGRVTIAPAMVIIKAPDAIDKSNAADADLNGVHPALVDIVTEAARRSDIPFDVIEGVRTKARQAQLVKAGASKTSDSRHITGHAVDLWPIDPNNGKRLPSDAQFKKGSSEAKEADARLWADLRKIAVVMKEVARERGVLLEWGGDWGWDAPHFQLNRNAYPA